MNKVIFSSKSKQDFLDIIFFIKFHWTNKEAQQFSHDVYSFTKLLEKGKVSFKSTHYKKTNQAVISKHISIFYQKDNKNNFQVLRIWDNRKNPNDFNLR